ncbi:DHH family phosphoesterase [Wansuia hejianensis]|uniref:Cyclic-di-AMP phosphodiesterase n=1 Tax=Wansuia hejianensis TaxID=2763667 RepID=A0A7G9G8K0_9FIRM|nr:DHH family phosphoesterase [Wansuia hejianensis]QNM07132.1 DHH family phosphoesterase [Wansuia hejianensis]
MDKINKIKLSGQLRSYLRCPLGLFVLLVAMNVGVYFLDVNAGLLVSAGIVLYLIIALIFYYTKRAAVFNELITFAAQYGQVQRQLIMDFSLPYAVLDDEGKLLWFNQEFASLTGKENRTYRKSITNIFSEITLEKFPGEGEEADYYLSYMRRDFRVHIKCVNIDSMIENSEILELEDGQSSHLYAMYLFDETQLNEYIHKYEDETMVTGLIYLDNYDEALESVEEVRRSLLTALIDRKINKYFNDIDGLVKKFEKDKYFLVMRTRSLNELKNMKFNILEEVKTVNIGNDMAVTISIGIGANSGSYSKNSDCARIAIDLALGRGGDQVVLKDGDKILYYGGKSQAVEKNTRVKARVKAHALKEFMDSKDKIIVMGHKIIDVDSFGAAVGIYRAAKTLNKKVHIVIDNPTSSIRPLMEGFLHNPDYDAHMFLNCHEAREMTDENTLVVVVDTNKPSYTECEELLYMTKTIVVLDHHRQGSEVIRNSVLSYIEPYASSACEMVAEILQYFADGIRIRNIEADAIYAGIMVDTDNFLQKTGVRTFEAAAFLRRCGADVTRVRKLFRENMNDYRARGETIRNAELFRESFAISECPSGYVDSPTIVGAQAANELLNIVGVKASFVLTEYRGIIYISARAIDEVNVQIIMERMGGGGHLNIAGCQLESSTVQEAKDYLKDTLTEMLDGGEI